MAAAKSAVAAKRRVERTTAPESELDAIKQAIERAAQRLLDAPRARNQFEPRLEEDAYAIWLMTMGRRSSERGQRNAKRSKDKKEQIRAADAPDRLKREAQCLDAIVSMFPDMQEKWPEESDSAYDEMANKLATNVPRLKRLMQKLRAAGRIPKHFSHPMPPRRA